MWASLPTDLFWRNALAVIPLVLVVAAVCRWLPCRPATRHALWLMVLLWLLIPPVFPSITIPTVGPADPPSKLAAAPAAAEVEAEFRTESARGRPEPGSGKQASRTEPRSPKSLALATGPVGGLFHYYEDPDVTPRSDGCQVVKGKPEPTKPKKSASRKQATPARVERPPLYAEADVPRSRSLRSSEPKELPQSSSRSLASNPSPTGQSRWRESGSAAHRVERSAGRAAPASVQAPSETEGVAEATTTEEAATGETPPETSAELRRWVAAVLAIRDAAATLPPIPTSAWVFGIVVVVLVRTGNTIRFRRYFRSAVPAPDSVVRLVRATAGKLGLPRVPETLMVDEHMSPMVWCGRCVRLLVPTALWEQLDGPSRQAVICHELAHLRRRDHWVRWIEVAVGSLYWWHPLVWWVRRRIRTEAEFCCDTWVTWLIPRGRRAYAEALLITKQYLDESYRPVPAVGIGVTTGRAGRFGRRLTMVMTKTTVPRLSVSGVALAVAVAMVGWVATPAQSCPPKAKASGGTSTHVTAHAGKTCGHHDSGKPCCPEESCKGCEGCKECAKSKGCETAGHSVEGEITTFEHYMTKRGAAAPVPMYLLAGDPTDMTVEDRLARLEAELDRLGDLLDRMAESLGEPPRGRLPKLPKPPKAPPLPPLPEAIPVPAIPGAPGFAFGKGERLIRAYELPEGKLEALTALMIRSDVPILVAPQEDRIEVHATAAHHAAFERFVELINPGEKSVRAYNLSPGKLEALTELMVRADVPVLVEPGAEDIKVHGTGIEQAVFGEFAMMIAPDSGQIGAGLSPTRKKAAADRPVRRAERKEREAKRKAERKQRKAERKAECKEREAEGKARQKAKRKARKSTTTETSTTETKGCKEVEGSHGGKGDDVKTCAKAALLDDAVKLAAQAYAEKLARREHALEAQVENFEQQAQTLEEQARKLEHQAQELELQAEQLEETAEDLRDSAEDAEEDDEQEALFAEANKLEAKAEALVAKAEIIENEAEHLEQQADGFAEAADEIRETIANLAEHAHVSD